MPSLTQSLGRARPRAEVGSWALLGAVALVQAAVFVPAAIWRYVDGDEGYYLLASDLVLGAKLPYRDFMFTQMPLLPYLYGLWTAVLGETWLTARLLSVAFAIALGVLLFDFARRRFGLVLAVVGLSLYVFSGLVFAWMPTVKTYAAATFFLFAALALVDRRDAAARNAWVAAGLLLALAVGTRLIFAAAAPAFVWAALRAAEQRARARALKPLATGFALGLVPASLFLVIDPGRFLFDNVGYHAFRSSEGLVGDFRQKARVAENLVGIGTPDGGLPQFMLLLVTAVVAAVSLRLLRRPFPLSLAIAGLLGVASFLPTPSYPQYFVTLVPFLVVGILELVAEIRPRIAGADAPVARAFTGVLAVGLAIYLLLATIDFHRYTRLHSDDRIGNIERVAAVVDRYTESGDEVLSAWPGYVYGSGAVQLSGLENDFAPVIAASLSPERARHYHLLTADGVEQAIESRKPRVVVFKLWHYLTPVPDWEGAIRRGGYRLVYTAPQGQTVFAGEVKVYARPGP